MKLDDLRAGIKYHTAKGDFVTDAPYAQVTALGEGKYLAELELCAEAGRFRFRDTVVIGEEGVFVQVRCTAEEIGEGVTGIGLSCGAEMPVSYEELSFFAPSAWYGKGELFEGKSNKYPLRGDVAGGGVDGLGAPVCAAFSAKEKRFWELEAVDPNYDAAIPSSGDIVIDGRNRLPGIGVRRGENMRLFYEMPATSYSLAGSGRSVRYYLPAEVGISFVGEYRVASFSCQEYRECMRSVWRRAYDKYASVNCGVDTRLARDVLLRYVADSYGVVNGIPQYMTNADHFVNESGFLYRNADMAYLMLAYGTATGNDSVTEKALAVLDSQVKNRFAGERQAFSFERSRAEGVYAVFRAYAFLKARGDDREDWLRFVKDEADRFESTDEYYSVPLLCALGRTRAAIAKGERIWEKFSHMHFYGGIVDFIADPVLDRESGYIGMLIFLALYDVTGEYAWAERAAFCADYLETYQNLRVNGYYALGTDGNEHYNMASVGNEELRLNGLSYISANCNGTDVFNVLAAPLFYRLSLICKDEHYYRYAVLLERNALEYIDLANKAGALCDVRLGSGIGFMNEYYQLAVSTDPVGPYTGTAHDAGIAWVQYCLLSSQSDILARTGKPFLRANKCEKMLQNIAGDCRFDCGEKDVTDLSAGDFYARTEFSAGELLSVELPVDAEKIVLAHGECYVPYRYTLSFFGAKGQTLLRASAEKAARFLSFRIPCGCRRIEIFFACAAVFRQVQIFGLAPVLRIREMFRRGKRCAEGEYRNGSAYSAAAENALPWSYLSKSKGAYAPLRYDNRVNAYRSEKDDYLCVKTGTLMHPGKHAAAVVAFTVPEDGEYSVKSILTPAPYLERFGAQVKTQIFADEECVAEKMVDVSRESNETVRLRRCLKAGSKLYFEIHSVAGNNTNCFVSNEILIKKERKK